MRRLKIGTRLDRAGGVALILVASLTCIGLAAPKPARADGLLSKLLRAKPSDDTFHLIHASDLAAMIARHDPTLEIFDANTPDFRQRHGVIPHAVMLSSSSGYDVAAELPKSHSAELVFYCANSH